MRLAAVSLALVLPLSAGGQAAGQQPPPPLTTLPPPLMGAPPPAQAPRAADGEMAALPPGAGQDEVEGICSACHSLRLVTQQRLSRRGWDEVLNWMVEDRGMPELDPEDRRTILDYLAGNFHPGVPRR